MITPPGNERTGILQRVTWLLLAPLLVGAATGLLVSALVWLFEIMSLGSLASSTTPWTVFVLLAALPLSVLCMQYIVGTLSPSTNEFYIIHSNERPVRMPASADSRSSPCRRRDSRVRWSSGPGVAVVQPRSRTWRPVRAVVRPLVGRSRTWPAHESRCQRRNRGHLFISRSGCHVRFGGPVSQRLRRPPDRSGDDRRRRGLSDSGS